MPIIGTLKLSSTNIEIVFGFCDSQKLQRQILSRLVRIKGPHTCYLLHDNDVGKLLNKRGFQRGFLK